MSATKESVAREEADVSRSGPSPTNLVKCSPALPSCPLTQNVEADRKPASDGNKAKSKREHHIPCGTRHFAVAGKRQRLKAEGRYRGVGSKDADRRELPRSRGGENPVARGRCCQNAKQKGAADID